MRLNPEFSTLYSQFLRDGNVEGVNVGPKELCQLNIILRNLSNSVMDNVQATLVRTVVGVENFQERLYGSINVSFYNEVEFRGMIRILNGFFRTWTFSPDSVTLKSTLLF